MDKRAAGENSFRHYSSSSRWRMDRPIDLPVVGKCNNSGRILLLLPFHIYIYFRLFLGHVLIRRHLVQNQ